MAYLSFVLRIISLVMGIIGLWFMFPKFGVSKFYTFCPIIRTYKLAQCANMEEDGKVFCTVEFLSTVLGYIGIFVSTTEGITRRVSNLNLYIFFLLTIIVFLISLFYSIRVYSALCRVFEKKRRYEILWVLFPGEMAFFWGISDKLQPIRMADFDQNRGAAESGLHAEAILKGLTINIVSRKATSGLHHKTLLKDIHMSIKPGNMVLLLGGSGAGKTTFLNAITGYEQANAEILLDGLDVYKHYDRMKYKIGFVPQQDLIRYHDTVYRTLCDAATLRMPSSVRRKARHERVNEVMNIFGLTPVKNNIVAKQSGGQKKRISIAAEFISDPAVFILDEPDSGLDGILAKDLMRRLHEISREDKIVIVITHTPDRVIEMFDKVIVLGKDEDRTGRLVFYGDIDEAKEFFGKDTMEDIVKTVNRTEEGGEGRADELIAKYTELRNGNN